MGATEDPSIPDVEGFEGKNLSTNLPGIAAGEEKKEERSNAFALVAELVAFAASASCAFCLCSNNEYSSESPSAAPIFVLLAMFDGSGATREPLARPLVPDFPVQGLGRAERRWSGADTPLINDDCCLRVVSGLERWASSSQMSVSSSPRRDAFSASRSSARVSMAACEKDPFTAPTVDDLAASRSELSPLRLGLMGPSFATQLISSSGGVMRMELPAEPTDDARGFSVDS
jgi:hypothetical protein